MSGDGVPAGLGPRGAGFWEAVTGSFVLDVAERELLVECARLVDECEELSSVLERDGRSVLGSQGQPRVHPAVGELRASRLALGRLLAQLALPDEDGASLSSPLSARGRVGAGSRWGARRGPAA
jgi:hypothetical protein